MPLGWITVLSTGGGAAIASIGAVIIFGPAGVVMVAGYAAGTTAAIGAGVGAVAGGTAGAVYDTMKTDTKVS